jgi:hypothetical protein
MYGYHQARAFFWGFLRQPWATAISVEVFEAWALANGVRVY